MAREQNYELWARVMTLLRNKHIIQKKFALLAQINPNDFHEWTKDHYYGDIEAFEDKIRIALEKEERKNMLTKTTCPTIIATSVTKRGFDCCQYVMENRGMGIFYGESGVGKTVTCIQFINENPDCIFIESLPSYSASAIVKRICAHLSLDEGRSLTDSFEMVVKALKDSGRLLIVDEGENLSGRGLQILRRLHDIGGVGVLLVGLPVLLSNVKSNNGFYTQLYNRIDIAVKAGSISEQDTEALVRHWLPEAAGLWKEFRKLSGDNTRRLQKLCAMAKRIAAVNGCKIDKEIILRAVDALIS